jgi:hypothetical protein
MYTHPLHIITSAYLIVCIQGKARPGLPLLPFRHNIRSDTVEPNRYSINMVIADNYNLAKNAQNSIDR